MKKEDLIDAIATENGLSKAFSKQVLNSILDAMTGALKNEEKVILKNFGTFSVATKAARKGRNPRTGEEVNIEAKKAIKFKSGSKLTNAVM